MPASNSKQTNTTLPITPNPLIEAINKLESKLLSNQSDPNPLLHLLSFARNKDAEIVHKSIWALHRVFIPLIASGNYGPFLNLGQSAGGNKLDEVISDSSEVESREVRRWFRERLEEYVEILAGLMSDSEAALRASSVPLLFSLLPPLSTLLPSPSPHIPYFRLLLSYFLEPTPSLRGAQPKNTSSSNNVTWEVVESNQSEESLMGQFPQDVVALIVDFWAKHDDIRWLFFREARLRLESDSSISPLNLLSQLMPLTNLPRKPADINTFFIPSLSSPPSSSSTSSSSSSKKRKILNGISAKGKSKKSKKDQPVDSTPAWLEDFESSSEDEPSTSLSTKSQTPKERVSRLSTLAGIHSIPSHIQQYTDLWLTILGRMKLDEQWTRKILVGLHGKNGILSHMADFKRIRVVDWLASLVDNGGVEAMLALNGIYVMMTQYNLDYPNFYPRLYTLLTPSLLHTRYRARFFRLLDTFLRSALLPATLIASFIKRLSRLSLTAPPGGIIIVVPFVYNLLKRHRGCMIMVQRYHEDDSEYNDPYDANDPSPISSKAIDSSLWEISSLQKHYLASISTLSGIFKEQFTKPEFGMEDFLDHGYSTMFETETKRRIKNAPSLHMDIELETRTKGKEVTLFPSTDLAEEIRSSEDLVARLWTF